MVKLTENTPQRANIVSKHGMQQTYTDSRDYKIDNSLDMVYTYFLRFYYQFLSLKATDYYMYQHFFVVELMVFYALRSHTGQINTSLICNLLCYLVDFDTEGLKIHAKTF